MRGARRFLAWFRPHLPALVAASALLTVGAAVPAGLAVLLQQALDRVLIGGDAAALLPICVGLGLVAAARGAAQLARTWITRRVGWTVTSELRRALHAHLLALDVDPATVGSTTSALLQEVDEVQYGVSALVTVLRDPLAVVGLAASAVWLAPSLAPWVLLLVPPVVAVAAWSGRRARRRGREAREARAELARLVVDQISGRDAIAAHGAHAREVDRFARVEARDREARIAQDFERALPSAATEIAVAAAAAVLLWVGGREVLSGSLEPGQFLGFAVALGLVHRPIAALTEVWALSQRSLAALERVEAVLDLPLPADPADPLPLPEGAVPLVVTDLWAGYGAEPVLRGVTMELRPGEIVALVGPSGGGKSTLLAVLRGAIPASSGEIHLGAVPLDRVRRADRRRAVALVPQAPALFDRDVRGNVALGDPPPADEAVWDALSRAGARFVADHPLGLDAPVGEGGRLLSGGERQRLLLARALLREPRVLLLDEATNQVDPELEASILDELRRGLGDRIALLVAHDPATAARADRVLRLDGGRLVELA